MGAIYVQQIFHLLSALKFYIHNRNSILFQLLKAFHDFFHLAAQVVSRPAQSGSFLFTRSRRLMAVTTVFTFADPPD
jgi:hypothetical protein